LDEAWKNEGTAEFYHTVSEIIMRTSTRCLQGEQIRSLLYTGYVDWIADIDRSLSMVTFFFPNLPLPSFRKRNISRKKLGEVYRKVLKHREDNKYTNDDYIELLMSKKYKDGTSMDEEEIAGLCIALTLAGYHTSNISSSWLGIHLLSHPPVLEALIKEQENIVGNDPLDFEKVKRMEFLECCMSESLRINPPIILIWRVAMQDFKVNDYVIPKGTLVCVSPATRHRSEAIYTKPNEYDPWRFSTERQESKKENNAFLAFSAGDHYCIGEKFAYLQVKTLWSVLLRRYDLKLVGTMKDFSVDHSTLMCGPKLPVNIIYKKKK